MLSKASFQIISDHISKTRDPEYQSLQPWNAKNEMPRAIQINAMHRRNSHTNQLPTSKACTFRLSLLEN